MADFDTMAANLYGGSTPAPTAPASAPTPAPTPAPTSAADAEQRIADRMYGGPPAPAPRDDLPADIQALRDTAERRMYPAAKAFAADLPDGSLVDFDASGTAEVREIAADLGAEPADLREFRTLANAATEVDIEAWRAESHAMLAERGYSQADLEGARQLARRDPRVMEYLNLTGLGDHPKVVERFIHLARAARVNGTLKRS